MKRFPKIAWIVILIIFTCLFFLVASFFYGNQRLRGLDIDKLVLSGDSSRYDVRDGIIYRDESILNPVFENTKYQKVANLAFFYKIEKEDPIFIGPEFKSDEYQQSVLALQKTSKELVRELGFSGEFLPTDFLVSLVQLDKAKKTFFSSPSEDTASKLIAAYEETQKRYKDDSQRILDDMIRLDRPSQDKTDIRYFGSVTSISTIQEDYKKIVENAGILSKEINERKGALAGEIYSLPTTISVIGEFPDSKTKRSELLSLDLLNENHYEQNGTAYGPVEVNTSCYYQKNQEPQAFYYFFPERGGRTFFFPKLATNNIYENTGTTESPSWRPVKEANEYRCNDITYQAEALRVGLFYDGAKDKDLIAKIDSSDMQKGGSTSLDKCKVAEKRFFSSDNIPTENQLDYLQSCYGNIYYNIKGNLDARNNLLLYYLTLRDKTQNISLILNNQFLLDEKNEAVQNGAKVAGEYDFLMGRSVYSITFLPFTDAAWRNPMKLDYVIHGRGSNARFSDYKTLIKSFSQSEIMSWRGKNQ